jgi:hypothetical protein
LATLLAGAAAVPAMMNYIDFITDPRVRDGSEAVVAAAVEHLGRDPGITITDHARTLFVDLYGVASRLRHKLGGAWRRFGVADISVRTLEVTHRSPGRPGDRLSR